MKYALISVSDKTGLVNLGKALIEANYKIISTGGTYNLLKENNIEAIEISDFTGEKEILGGRIKTLGRKIHSGLLFDPQIHKDEANNIEQIDIIVCNFYPFEKKVREAMNDLKINKKNIDEVLPSIIENIDIGGPTMINSAIKNYKNNKLIISDPEQYNEIISILKNNFIEKDGFDKHLIKKYVAKAAKKIALYRLAVANFFNSELFLEEKFNENLTPLLLNKTFKKIDYDFRYGENPHQEISAGYKDIEKDVSIFDAEILNEGKIPSFNNIADMNAAIKMILDFNGEERTDIIMKHGNPCGVGFGENAFVLACESDQISRFGGIYVTNKKITLLDAEKIGKKYLEIILAPGFDNDAIKLLIEKDPRRRIFDITKILLNFKKNEIQLNSVIGGIIVQQSNDLTYNKNELKIVSNKKPLDEEIDLCIKAFKIVKHCNSNAIAIVNQKQVIGLGVGQMSRLDSVNIAIMKAKEAGFELKGSVLASDAFFPKSDGVLNAINEGVLGIIQPGGSKQDNEIIEKINENNVFMIFTNIRHFKHSR